MFKKCDDTKLLINKIIDYDKKEENRYIKKNKKNNLSIIYENKMLELKDIK